MVNSEHATRVALLCAHGYTQHKKVLHLVDHIADETILLNSDCADESLCDTVAECDLILIEAHRHLNERQWQAIRWVRIGSLAPIVVLLGEKPTDDAMNSIVQGADAVLSLQLNHDVILAHCQALMRRWRTHPYATPKFA